MLQQYDPDTRTIRNLEPPTRDWMTELMIALAHPLLDTGNMRKESCQRGHPRSPENTYWKKSKRWVEVRECKPCIAIREK